MAFPTRLRCEFFVELLLVHAGVTGFAEPGPAVVKLKLACQLALGPGRFHQQLLGGRMAFLTVVDLGVGVLQREAGLVMIEQQSLVKGVGGMTGAAGIGFDLAAKLAFRR